MEFTSIAVVVAGYLMGSVDFGVIVPRLRGMDIYSHGSGNPGASNVMRSLGRGAAAAVVLGDIGKGVAAAALGDLAAGEAAGFAAGAAAVVGHCWPLWHRFRGGKGVAAAAGMTLWLEPVLGLGMLVLWGVLVALTRRASIASLVVVSLFVPGVVVTGHRGWSVVWAALVAVVVAGRHRHNVKRLLEGSEHTLEADSA